MTADARERAQRVLDHVDDLIEHLPVPASHRALLGVHVDEARAQVHAYPWLAPVELPLLVHSAIAGTESPAVPVAAACTFVSLGADLIDDIADDELPSCWREHGPAQASLAATTYLSALPAIALAGLERTLIPGSRIRAISDSIASSLVTMSAGQHLDLLYSERPEIDLETCRTMLELKAGSEIALFARSGALLATDDQRVITAYAALGFNLGTAGTIANDLTDVWQRTTSQDLLTGKLTLPIVHALSVLRGMRRQRLERTLADARTSAEAHPEVRGLLDEAGSLRYALLVAGIYRRRALNHLLEANPLSPAREELAALVEQVLAAPPRAAPDVPAAARTDDVAAAVSAS